MNRKTVSGIMATLMLASMLTLIYNLTIAHASPDTILYIEPASVVDPALTPGSSFTVDVMVSDVEFLFAWQVNMTFNSEVLNFINVTEGDFLASQPDGTFGTQKTRTSSAIFGWSTIGYYQGISGSGVLATVEFEVVAEGESLLKIETDPVPGTEIYLTFLTAQSNPTLPPDFDDLDFTAEYGYFNNFGVIPPIYDLIETIESWTLHRGTEKSLIAKLKVAEHMLDMGREDGAIRKLTAFINRVENLRNKTLTNEQADYLRTEAQRIIDLIKA